MTKKPLHGMRPPVIALPKGRLFDPAVEFLASVGLDEALQLRANDRRLVFLEGSFNGSGNGSKHPGFIIARPHDVVQFVYHGAADLGIVGNDVLREQELAVFEPLDLKFGRCRLVLAGSPQLKQEFIDNKLLAGGFARLSIATSYPHICERWAKRQNLDVQIRPLYGSVEIAPATGFSDVILDLVSSGETLRQNGLEEIATVLDVSARLIVNRAALKTRSDLAGYFNTMKKVLLHKRPLRA